MYAVVFSGEVDPTAIPDAVKANLQERFKLSEERVQALFCGKPVVIKKCPDMASAQTFAQSLSQMGAICRVVDPSGSTTDTPVPDNSSSSTRSQPSPTSSQADQSNGGTENDGGLSNDSSYEFNDMSNSNAATPVARPSGQPAARAGGGSLIKLEGNSTPNLLLSSDEQVLLDLSQGWRDLGILAKIFGHKGRFIATNKRAIYFKKKTKDYDIRQMRMSHAGSVHMGHSLQFMQFLFGLILIGGGIVSMVAPQGDLIGGLIMFLIGGFMMWTARVQGLTLSGSGDKIVFATKSVPQQELSKILTVINSG